MREITDDDASDIFEYLSDDTVTKYLVKESLTNINGAYEIINKIKTNYNDCKDIRWGIIHKENRKLIGTIYYDVTKIKNKRIYSLKHILYKWRKILWHFHTY